MDHVEKGKQKKPMDLKLGDCIPVGATDVSI
jgi:hypothetical protein